eukprot:3665995-Alexandrium_andersonii.AAC.1
MYAALALLLRSIGAARGGVAEQYTQLAGWTLMAMAHAVDVPARLLYGRWIAELYVLVVFE